MAQQTEVLRHPLKRPTKRAQMRMLASMITTTREPIQLTVMEEMITEALARTGAKSFEELVRRMEAEGKIWKGLRMQPIPRPTVETPRRSELIQQAITQQETIESLPSAVQIAIRNIMKYITKIERAIIALSLQSELKWRQHNVEQLDKLVDTLKSVCAQLGVKLTHSAVAAALSAAADARLKQIDRILTLRQQIESAAREKV